MPHVFVERVFNTEGSSIFELDETTNELFFRVLSSQDTHTVAEVRLKMGEGIAGWVARTGESVIVPDTARDPRFTSKVDRITGFKTRSLIALPIRNKGRLIGVLELVNKLGPSPFNQEDLEFLTVAANQIGIAIANARLYHRLQQQFTLTQTELKKAQEQLIRTERLAALAELSAGVAHEVRNPVMSIGGFARRLKKKLPSDKTPPSLCGYYSEGGRSAGADGEGRGGLHLHAGTRPAGDKAFGFAAARLLPMGAEPCVKTRGDPADISD